MAQRPLRCLITGGNTGLGFEVAKQLLLKGHEVIIACRDVQKGQQAVQQLQQHAAPTSKASVPPSATTDASRDASSSDSSSAQVTAVQCDLASFTSVRSCAAAVAQRWPQLDVLVCNAAVIPSKPSRTVDGIDEQLQVNHLSHFLLTDLLLPCMIESAEARARAALGHQTSAVNEAAIATRSPATTAAAEQQHLQQPKSAQDQHGSVDSSSSSSSSRSRSRIVVVGSSQHTTVPAAWQDPHKLQLLLSGGPAQQQELLPPMQLYALTKLCNLWFTRYLAAHVLKAAGSRVVANVVTPGFIPSTDLGRHMAGNVLSRFFMKFIMPWAPFAVTVQEGAQRVLSVCLDEGAGCTTGQYFARRQATQPSPAAMDDSKAAVCWQLSCEATGVSTQHYGGLHVQ